MINSLSIHSAWARKLQFTAAILLCTSGTLPSSNRLDFAEEAILRPLARRPTFNKMTRNLPECAIYQGGDEGVKTRSQLPRFLFERGIRSFSLNYRSRNCTRRACGCSIKAFHPSNFTKTKTKFFWSLC